MSPETVSVGEEGEDVLTSGLPFPIVQNDKSDEECDEEEEDDEQEDEETFLQSGSVLAASLIPRGLARGWLLHRGIRGLGVCCGGGTAGRGGGRG